MKTNCNYTPRYILQGYCVNANGSNRRMGFYHIDQFCTVGRINATWQNANEQGGIVCAVIHDTKSDRILETKNASFWHGLACMGLFSYDKMD